MVGGLFAVGPELRRVTLEWVSIFQMGGSEYRAGQSWLHATYDGQQIVAFLPQDSVFRMKGRLFALLPPLSIPPCSPMCTAYPPSHFPMRSSQPRKLWN